MFKIIESPGPCQVRSVIRFLSARNLSAADSHRRICEVYGATALCEGKVRKWVRDFKAGRDAYRHSVFEQNTIVTLEGSDWTS
ncbi:hypothetical protein AVEN_213993-1, partial [Araneus ventricosus]